MNFKKAIFIVPTLPGGGAERFAVNLANFLVTRNFDITVYNIGKSEDLKYLIDSSKVKYIYNPRNSKFDIKPLRDLHKYVNENKIKYFIFIELFSFFYAKLITFFWRFSFKSLITFHYTDVRNIKERIQYFIYSLLIRKTDKIIAICNYQRKKLYNDNKFPFEKDDIKVIYNGVDSKYFSLPPADLNKTTILNELNIPINSKIIIKVAGFRSEKRHIDAIYSLAELHNKYNCKAFLLLAGTGDLNLIESIKSLISKLNLDSYVRFLGFQKDVRKYLWISDMFTLTSNSVETFSFAALEALSTGLPIVITDLGGAKEMVIDDKNGFVVPPNNVSSIANAWFKTLNGNFNKNAIAENTYERFYINKIHGIYEEIIITHGNF